jgi:predicted PurR-regulated permease PerM
MAHSLEVEQRKVISVFLLILYVCLFILGIVTLYALRALIPPLLVATFFAMTLINEVDRMERRGWRRGVSIGVIYLLFLAMGGLAVWAINIVASGEMSTLVSSLVPPSVLHGSPNDVAHAANEWMIKHRFPIVLRPAVLNEARHVPAYVNRWVQWVTGYLPAFAESLLWLVIVPVMTFFILLDFHKILGKIFILVPIERREGLLNVVTEIIAVIGNYVRGVLIVMASDIVVIYITLRLFDFQQYALPLAMMAGVLYTIPYFGAIVSTCVSGLVGLAIGGWGTALEVTAVMIVIHQVIYDNIVAPRVIGRNVNLHPLLTLLALMAGGTLFGIGGALLAVPVAASLQVVLVHLFPRLRTDERSMEKAEHVVKTTLSVDIETSKPDGNKKVEARKARADRRRAIEEAKQPSPTPPVLPPGATESEDA